MDELPVYKPYEIRDKTKFLMNNSMLSDVSFLIGNKKKKHLYGHKHVLALASPVFYKMFYGDLKAIETQINVTDLAFDGFFNMIRYIYGFRVTDIAFRHLFETYIAADKYMVDNLCDEIIKYARDNLKAENCCIIYDQIVLIATQFQNVDLNQFETFIKLNSKAAFNSKYFVQIQEETLIRILKMNFLAIDEIDILRACSVWVNSKIARLELNPSITNKRKHFKPIKQFIRFSEITIENIKDFNEIENLLEDYGPLLLYLIDKSSKPLKIICKTDRKKLGSAFLKKNVDHFKRTRNWLNLITVRTNLNVNAKVSIYSILTLLPNRINNLRFGILENEKFLNMKFVIKVENARLVVVFDNFVQFDPINNYTLIFQFDSFKFSSQDDLSNEFYLTDIDKKLEFKISGSGYHCVEGIYFLMP